MSVVAGQNTLFEQVAHMFNVDNLYLPKCSECATMMVARCTIERGKHMFKWFRDCKTAETGKQLYRELVRKFHPDNGGSGVEIKEINAEFSIWWEKFKNIHTNENGQIYTDEKGTTETAEDFMDIISNLSRLSGIELEICGKWLWISGNTYPVREQLKSFGCSYASGKRKWYWTKEPFQKHRCKGKSMKAIRFRYGSQKVDINPAPCLT